MSLQSYVLPLCAVFLLFFTLIFSFLFSITIWTSFLVILSFFLVGIMLSPQFLLRFVQRTFKYDVHLICTTSYVGTLTTLLFFA